MLRVIFFKKFGCAAERWVFSLQNNMHPKSLSDFRQSIRKTIETTANQKSCRADCKSGKIVDPTADQKDRRSIVSRKDPTGSRR